VVVLYDFYIAIMIDNIFYKLSLRTMLIVPFVVQIFAVVGIVGWLSFRNGQQAVNDLAMQLRHETIAHIETKVQHLLNIPHHINRNYENLVNNKALSIHELVPWENYLWQQLQQYDAIHFTSLGNQKEQYISMERNYGSAYLKVVNENTCYEMFTYEVFSQGDKHLLYENTLFTPTTRPWYIQAKEAGKAIWSQIYPDFVDTALNITANLPFYDKNGKLLGVANTGLRLTKIGDFLKSLKTGHTFIVERSGLLVASSTQEEPFNRYHGRTIRIHATDSENNLTKATAKFLRSHFGDLNFIHRTHQLDFFAEGEQQFLQVTPLRDDKGLDWLIVLVVPESTFMSRIHANTHSTFLLSLIAVSLAILFAIVTAWRIMKPIRSLNRAAKKLSQREWDQSLPIDRIEELGELAEAFNSMSTQLKQSFIYLHENEERLKQFLEAMPVGVSILDRNGKLFYHNQKAQEIFGDCVKSNANMDNLTKVYHAYIAGTETYYPAEKLPIVRALQGETTTVDDIQIHHTDKIIAVEAWGTPILDDDGKISYAISAFQDITQRKYAEAERQQFANKIIELNTAYERFMPRQFLSLLDKDSIIDVQLGDQAEKEMTVMFSDIRQFTTIAEKMLPQDIFDFLNSYLAQMEPIISQHHGFIDKYIGDAIMALFPTNANDALDGAISMLKALVNYNILLEKADLHQINIGIGLNTGPLILGTVGGHNRMDGTVVADTVNIASRIEGLTKVYGSCLLITEQTYLKLQTVWRYKIRLLDRVKVKGKSKFLTVYEVYDADPDNIATLKTQTLCDFEQGFTYYHRQDFIEAKRCFQSVLQLNPDDKAAKVYLSRCDH